MPLTRPFKNTVKARAERDAGFREALNSEGTDATLCGQINPADLVEDRHLENPREPVLAVYEASVVDYAKLYKKLAE